MAEVQACKRTSLWIDAWACFPSRNVETAAFGELFQLLNLQNHVIISLALSLLQMDIDVISWKRFLLSNSNISHTDVYLSEREVVLCYYINIFDIYYFKVSMSKHHTLAYFTGPCESISLQWFLKHFGVQHYLKTVIFHLFVLGYNLLLYTLEKHKRKNKLMTFLSPTQYTFIKIDTPSVRSLSKHEANYIFFIFEIWNALEKNIFIPLLYWSAALKSC